jgi:predicted short-subunit dehydrogenase-like oxidoreductase (DUF2520 family)
MASINIVGAGRVGKTLGRLLQQHQLVTIQNVYNRSLRQADAAVAFIGKGQAVSSLEELQPAAITLITTPDDAIAHVSQQLADAGLFGPGAMVVHCSGALPADVLEPARAAGAVVGSLHPLKSIADSEQAVVSFQGTFCTIDGDTEAVALLKRWVDLLGGQAITIASEQKLLYHAASVLACSGLTTLFGSAAELYQRCGINAEQAQAMLGPFLQEILANNIALGAKQALTGPVARGDAELIAQHDKVLASTDEHLRALYLAMTESAKDLR